MKASVHILATCNNPALLDATRLVFKTIRVGFPTARLVVYGNGLDSYTAGEVQRDAAMVKAEYVPYGRTAHDAWIDNLLNVVAGPFWICDTDMVFFGPVEHWQNGKYCALAGRYEPEFMEEWTGTRHVARLHTCLMYFQPEVLRPAMRAWMGKFPALFATAQMSLVRQRFSPVRGSEPLFYDTCAGIYQAGVGTPFTREQNEAFEHLHCGTYVDQIAPHLSLPDLRAAHRAIYADPQQARGLQREQAKYYALRATPAVRREQAALGAAGLYHAMAEQVAKGESNAV